MIVPVLAGCAAGGSGRSPACACCWWRSFLSWPGRWCGRGGSRPLARMPRGPRCWCPSPSSAQLPSGSGGPGCHDPVDGVCRPAADLAAAGHRDRAGGGRGGGGRCVRRWFRLPYTEHRTDVWGLLLQRQAEGASAAPVFTDGSRRAAFSGMRNRHPGKTRTAARHVPAHPAAPPGALGPLHQGVPVRSPAGLRFASKRRGHGPTASRAHGKLSITSESLTTPVTAWQHAADHTRNAATAEQTAARNSPGQARRPPAQLAVSAGPDAAPTRGAPVGEIEHLQAAGQSRSTASVWAVSSVPR
jgi:hypothetical protein